MLPTLTELEAFLADVLHTAMFPPDDPRGVWRPGADPTRPVARLGLALEPWPGLTDWVRHARLDALWLHRPWRLAELSRPSASLPETVGVLAHHLAFDERLTTGLNPRLADALGFAGRGAPEPFGEKDGRPLGMVGALADAAIRWETFVERVAETFGGTDEVTPVATSDDVGDRPLVFAVVGAMTDALVRTAAVRGVRVYVTGQWRRPATEAVRATGIGVVAVGHARAERWGVRALAGLLQERWAELQVLLPRTGEADETEGE